MARRLAVFEAEVDTDFALLNATQPGFGDGAEAPFTFAVSAIGELAMVAGTRFARLAIRAERWDARPDPVDRAWEDVDELPWHAVDGAGPLQVFGFDPPDDDDDGLDVEGLGRCRVEVLARGRYRYAEESVLPDNLPREEWLLRAWPDPDILDALTGPPRRLVTDPYQVARRTPWQAAMHGWGQAGWSMVFLSLPVFPMVERALLLSGHPVTAQELLEWVNSSTRVASTLDWDTALAATVSDRLPGRAEDVQSSLLRLARAADLPAVATVADVLACLQRLELVAVLPGPRPRLLPNPHTRPAWEVLDLPAAAARSLRWFGLRADHAVWQPDLLHLARWAPDATLTTTARQIGVRLAAPVEDVLGTLRMLELDLYPQAHVEPPADSIDADTTVRLTIRTQPAAS